MDALNSHGSYKVFCYISGTDNSQKGEPLCNSGILIKYVETLWKHLSD